MLGTAVTPVPWRLIAATWRSGCNVHADRVQRGVHWRYPKHGYDPSLAVLCLVFPSVREARRPMSVYREHVHAPLPHDRTLEGLHHGLTLDVRARHHTVHLADSLHEPPQLLEPAVGRRSHGVCRPDADCRRLAHNPALSPDGFSN
jgi:hypothetical protein